MIQIPTDDKIIDGVLEEFLGICNVPHGSGNEGQIAVVLIKRLRSMGFEPFCDDNLNVICDIDATDGCEDAPLVILQGHSDMVCAVLEESDYNPTTDGIIAIVKDGCIRSNGRSSLGADCGIGIACVLYALCKNEWKHGPIRLLFTSGEEIGLRGAQRLDAKYLQDAKYLINTDGFKEGDIVISSSGGRRETYIRKLQLTKPFGTRAFKLKLGGFLGGHSGYDINKGRCNTIKVLSAFLGELKQQIKYDITDFKGGIAHNAIPFTSEVTIVVEEKDAKTLSSHCFHLSQKIIDMYGMTDSKGFAKLIEVEVPEFVWSEKCRDSVIDLCILLYNGVYSMDGYIKDHVSSSSNLGLVAVNSDNMIEVGTMVRCAVDANEEIIALQHNKAAELTGFAITVKGYKGWPTNINNPLVHIMNNVYFQNNHKYMNVTVFHAGLETSAFYAKNPELMMVSSGIDVNNPHSLDEHVPVNKIPPYIKLLWGTIEAISLQ